MKPTDSAIPPTFRPRGLAAGRLRACGSVLAAVLLAGCDPTIPRTSTAALVESSVFATWPRVTERPVRVSSALWLLCRLPTAGETEALDSAAVARHGPHTHYSIVVRVSPDAETAFREGRPLPPGAVVIKEKYADASASGPMQAYAVMAKRAGFDPAGGDWEYAYVSLAPERKMTSDRLAGCAGCHASARATDFLFRSYGAAAGR